VGAAGIQFSLMRKGFLQAAIRNRQSLSCLSSYDNVTLRHSFTHLPKSFKTKHCLDTQQNELSVRFLLNETNYSMRPREKEKYIHVRLTPRDAQEEEGMVNTLTYSSLPSWHFIHSIIFSKKAFQIRAPAGQIRKN
jgi:hypothetical protein